MLHLLLTAAILALPIQQPASGQDNPPAPIQVSRKEAHEHAIGDGDQGLYLRVPQNQWSGFASVWVTVVVDATGAIVSSVPQVAIPDGNHNFPSSVLAQAEAMVRTVHFKPFERAGHPVSVTFDWYVELLPQELKPAQHVPFPKVKDWKTVKITLARTYACFGYCPAYKVEVRGDGSVVYEGQEGVAFTGVHRGLVPQSNVIELVKLFEKADYYSLCDEYRAGINDATEITSISIDGRQKQVVDHVGLSAGLPLAVEQLEVAIDRLSGSERWTRGNSETMAALEAEHWGFKSHEAAATLARAAELGNADVVRDLAQAGVPLTGGEDRGGFVAIGEGESLQIAAFRGDLAMVRALLQAGAGSNPRVLGAALVSAAESGNIDVLHLLLESGAPMISRDAQGRTVLMAAAASGYPEMVREVLKNHAAVNAFAILPPPTCTEEMKKNGNCREFAEGEGQTALMEAVFRKDDDVPPEGVDRMEVVRLLLAAGADVNARDAEGDTALLFCHMNLELASLLLRAGADPNVRNHDGDTPLHLAGSDEMQRLLIEHGAVATTEAAKE